MILSVFRSDRGPWSHFGDDNIFCIFHAHHIYGRQVSILVFILILYFKVIHWRRLIGRVILLTFVSDKGLWSHFDDDNVFCIFHAYH